MMDKDRPEFRPTRGLYEVFGVVLEEAADFEGDLGFVYQKRGDDYEARHRFELPAIVMVRCATMIEVKAGDAIHRVDANSCLIIPAETEFTFRGTTTICDTVVFLPAMSLIDRVAADYRLDPAKVRSHFSQKVSVLRTNWLNELMHRYIFERVVARASGNISTRFLETEIVKEMYYRVEETYRLKGRFDFDDKSMDGRNPTLRKALNFIEANLFKHITMAEIARFSGASESTLLRAFQEGIHKTPFCYMLERRLDEAMALLKSRRYSVGEVSDLVGYESLSAFSTSFKKRFGMKPSEVV